MIDISIHALLAESDHIIQTLAKRINRFLSTLSLRRATRLWIILYSCPGNFYPRSPCGERRQIKQTCRAGTSISIHALLAESDVSIQVGGNARSVFLSTLSLRRATIPNQCKIDKQSNFYPRSPCGERRGFGAGSWPRGIFLSTLSLRRATGSHYCSSRPFK